MAVDSRGADGHPIFVGTSAPDTGADLTTLGEEIYERGTRLIGTTAERNAYAYKVPGLAWYDTDDECEYVWTGSAWDGAGINLSSYLIGGFTGSLTGNIRGRMGEIVGSVTGVAVPSGTAVVNLASGLPVEVRPGGTDNRWGTIWGDRAIGGVVVRPDGTMSITNRSGIDWGSALTLQITVTYSLP